MRTPLSALSAAAAAVLRRAALGDVLLGLAVVALALSPFVLRPFIFGVPSPVTLVLAFVAVVTRRSPAVSAVVTVVLAALQPFPGDGLTPVVLAYVVVVYSLAAYGGRVLRTSSAVAAVIGGAYASYSFLAGGGRLVSGMQNDADAQWPTIIAPTAVLLGAWLAGSAVRFSRAERGEAALRVRAEQRAVDATESARIERVRAEMARDVHDVVGHSLAVIIAQADSAAFTDEPVDLHRITQSIAAAARSSLHEVRDVLAGIDDEPVATDPTGIAVAVEELRETSFSVEHAVRGRRGLLGDAEGAVARRVVQEITTNVLRHADPYAPVTVLETWWPDAVVIEVRNSIADAVHPGSGRGLGNMEHRARGVGGAFETTIWDRQFTARVRLPAASVAGEGVA